MKNGSDYNDRSFFDLDHLLYLFTSLEGRINRQRYVLGYLLLAIPVIVLAFVLISMGFSVTALLVIAAAQFASAMLVVKRLRDRDRNPWLVILFFMPIIQFWLHIEFWFLPGTEGDNRFGSDPRRGESQPSFD